MTVLGTRFLVVTDGRRTSTVVIEGRVSCVPPGGARLPALTAGMRRDLGGEQPDREHTWTGVDLRAAIAWVPGGEADTPPPFPGADQIPENQIPENWQQR